MSPRTNRWLNVGVVALLIVASVMYMWNITASGYGNSFYAAVVRAGSKDWTALLFGSLDSANGITVDKPPAAYWIPALFARVFGFSSFTVLFPQAVMGVATVWTVFCTVKRTSGKAIGLLAGALMTMTPVAVMMFRFNNPDAMLTLCLALGAYFTVRAIQSAKRSDLWMLATGLIIGLAFLTKMLQGFMTLPALGLAFLIAAQGGWFKRVRGLIVGVIGVALPVVAYAGVFYAWPSDERPYMAGTENNDFWELVFGYNGLGRIFGGSGNGGGGGGGMGGGNSSFGGSTGILRMFNSGFGPEIAWLLPSAVILLLAGLWATRRAARTDLNRAALIVWGGWLLVIAGVFSFMEGTIHPYYVVVLAPAIAACVAIGAGLVTCKFLGTSEYRSGRGHRAVWYRSALAAAVAAGGATGYYLMATSASDWLPWLRWVLLIGSLCTAIAIVIGLDRVKVAGGKNLTAVVLLAALVFGAGGTTAWSLASVGNAYTGSIPASGPASAGGGMGGMGGGGMGGGRGGPGGQTSSQSQSSDSSSSSGSSDSSDSSSATSNSSSDSSSSSTQGQAPTGGGEAGGSSSELVALLQKTDTTYSAAMSGATGAAELMINSDTDVLDIGGWNGSDPFPTLAQFKQMVADGEISYYISGGQGSGGPGGGNDEIASWVAKNYSSETVGNYTVYDLTDSTSSDS